MATGLPTNGTTLYVTLWSIINGQWQARYYTYTAYGTPVLAVLTSPTPGTQLPGSSATFTWTAGTDVSSYALVVGTFPGGQDLYAVQTKALTAMATGLPTNGTTLYVTLWSIINGQWQARYYTYTAY